MKRKTKNILMITILLLSAGGLIFSIFTIKNRLNNTMPENNMQEISEKPSGELGDIPEKPYDEMSKPPEKPSGEMDDLSKQELNNKVEVLDYIVLALYSLSFSVALFYLIMSRFNKLDATDAFSNKALIYVIGFIISSLLLTIVPLHFLCNANQNDKSNIENNSKEITYNASTIIIEDKTLDNETYKSEAANQNALLVKGNITVYVNNTTVTKSGDSDSGDDTSFYGINSSILAKDKVQLHIDNMTITTNATGANGVFSYGNNSDGTSVVITNSKITTTGNSSGGIMATGGGIINATNLDILTSGASSAAIRSDRGGGTINVELGTYRTTGVGSPAIYSTADITVATANLVSEASEGVVIEGANSVNLKQVNLTDTNNKLNGKSSTYKNIFLYQSMSGDAKEGTAVFNADSCNIATNKGDTIYVTNTSANIKLTNNFFTNNDPEGNFLRIQKDSWGKTGSNGGNVTMNLINQTVIGNIVVDEISTLDMSLENSNLETTINNKNEAKEIKLKLDKTSKLKLTGDSYLTSFIDEDTTYKNIDFNGYKLYVGEKELETK